MIELLTVLAILGILAAWILPAVQSSREAARRVQCSSNLRQIALAVQNYSETHSAYPGDGGAARQSFQVRLLPFTGNESLYAQIDFEVPIEMQGSIASNRPAYLSCPSETASATNRMLNSYGGNAGWPAAGTRSPESVPGTGTRATGVISFLAWGAVTPRGITDGMSSTALVCDTLPTNGRNERTVVWQETPSSLPTYHRPPDVIARDCLSASTWAHQTRGGLWARGGYGATLYEHALTPNSRNCRWAFPAMSEHSRDGVNVAYCDGAAKFVSSSVSTTIWRAIGTRSGNETDSGR